MKKSVAPLKRTKPLERVKPLKREGNIIDRQMGKARSGKKPQTAPSKYSKGGMVKKK